MKKSSSAIPPSADSSVILSPSILPLVMACCSPSCGPTVPVTSEPVCFRISKAVELMHEPLLQPEHD